MEKITIPYESKEIAAILFRHKGTTICTGNDKECGVILTHGAGGDMHNKHLVELATLLSAQGHDVLCFTCKGLNVVYRAKVFGKIVEYFCSTYNPKVLIVGGRSMGARAAVMVADPSTEFCNRESRNRIKGIVCLAFPLHTREDSTSLRDNHLLKLQTPIFFLSGTKDELGKKEIFEKTFRKLSCSWQVEWMLDFNHSFTAKGKKASEVYTKACSVIGQWIEQILKENEGQV